jgi:hypothetical protein
MWQMGWWLGVLDTLETPSNDIHAAISRQVKARAASLDEQESCLALAGLANCTVRPHVVKNTALRAVRPATPSHGRNEHELSRIVPSLAARRRIRAFSAA